MLKVKNVFYADYFNLRKLGKEIIEIDRRIVSDFGGGSSLNKVNLMAALTFCFDIDVTLDIGVYRGKSLFPQALAHKFKKQGIVLGIDPYSNSHAVQTDRKDIEKQLFEFAQNTNFEEIYNTVQKLISQQELTKFAKIIRLPSDDAVSYVAENFLNVGLIHIDGNHDTKHVMNDVLNYSPLIKSKGFIVLDDASWSSVVPAYNYLKDKMVLVGEVCKRNDDFALFSYGHSITEIGRAKFLFENIIKI